MTDKKHELDEHGRAPQQKTGKHGKPRPPESGTSMERETVLHRRTDKAGNPIGRVGSADDPAFEQGDARRVK